MNEPMNIAHHGRTSNYRLRFEPVKLNNRIFKGYYKPDGDGYEEVWEESDELQRYKLQMRLRGSRKQRAAYAAIPKSTIKVVSEAKPKDPAVVHAILDKRPAEDIRILDLEAQVRQLMGLLKK